jgi:hypothetical protein
MSLFVAFMPLAAAAAASAAPRPLPAAAIAAIKPLLLFPFPPPPFVFAAPVVGLASSPPMTVSTPEPRRARGRTLLAAMASQSATETPRCCWSFF